jgi:hypothetical protein
LNNGNFNCNYSGVFLRFHNFFSFRGKIGSKMTSFSVL